MIDAAISRIGRAVQIPFQGPTSLLPQATGTPRGAKRIDPKVESLIAEQIDRHWLKKERPSMSSLMQRVHDACRVDGLRPPNRRTLERPVDELQPRLAARRRGEGDILAAATSSPGAYATISRELQRNALPSGGYSPLHAAGGYQLRRQREAILERESDLRLFVGDRLAEGWTPEQISGWLRDMTTWFCDAYASWQKGGVENANGRLRRWLPRHLDIDRATDQEIQEIVLTTNLTPRKCLGFKTPFQALIAELGKDVQIRFS